MKQLHGRESQYPNARPTVLFGLSGVSIRTAIVLISIPEERSYHHGANGLRNGVCRIAERMRSS